MTLGRCSDKVPSGLMSVYTSDADQLDTSVDVRFGPIADMAAATGPA